ncbi:MAG: RnfABCDGE type electron transport complex subunit B [Victivallaceae bacterium]|nr:RnfABCDGE type electron transport complex subunit B [Victivallaceae bacterium]
MSQLVAAVALMTLLGILLGVAIGFFVRRFSVKTDSRIDLVTELLPGANCGGCGYAGCADFARAVVEGRELPSKCSASSQDQVNAIANALGIETGHGFARKAIVACSGDSDHEKIRVKYNGTLDCLAAQVVSGGPKNCRYGCLGMGSCARVCPFGAIEIRNGVARVHAELCTGCGKCVEICPRHVIHLVPADATAHVFCNSPEKGALKRKYCTGGCIGCGKCSRHDPRRFRMNGFLASIDYTVEDLPDAGDVEAVGCPVKALRAVEEETAK